MEAPTAPIPHTLADYVLYVIVAILASGSTYLFPKLKRKQTAADIHKTEADANKSDAETRQINLTGTMNAGDMLLRFMQQVMAANLKVEQLQGKMEFWQAKFETEKARADLAELELDKKIRIGDGK